MRLEWHHDAERELIAEAEYIEAQRRGSGLRFLQVADEAALSLIAFPLTGSPRQRGVRRKAVTGFRYDIVYKLRRDGVLFIIAIAHHSRHPRYWRDRLE